MTAKGVYDMAVQLLGFKNINGTDSDDCTDLLNRSPELLNIIIHENLNVDRILCDMPDKKAVVISTLQEDIDSHDALLYTVFPYGLAAMLIGQDDTALYGELYKRYTDARQRITEEHPSMRHGIEDCYSYNG